MSRLVKVQHVNFELVRKHSSLFSLIDHVHGINRLQTLPAKKDTSGVFVDRFIYLCGALIFKYRTRVDRFVQAHLDDRMRPIL